MNAVRETTARLIGMAADTGIHGISLFSVAFFYERLYVMGVVLGTLQALDEAVDGLELSLDGAELVGCQRALDRLSAKLGAAYGEFDAAECWDLDAATSMTAWLRDQVSMNGGEASRVLRSARRLHSLPVTAAAALDGTLSAGQVKAIVANVTDATAELFAEHEAELVPTLAPLPVADVAAAMRTWAALAEDALDLGEPEEPSSKVRLSSMLDGIWRLDGHLDALDGEILDTALRLAAGADDDAEAPRTPAQRRADALVNICKSFLDNEEQPPGRRNRPHINVIVTKDDLEAGRGGECADGTVLDGPSLASLVCDSVLHRIVMAGSVILDYGTATRTISANLFNALVVRDRHCRFPGCDRPAAWTDAHHVVHVEDGGPTCPSNCVLLCRRHHRRLHRTGWSAELQPDGDLVVTDPGGRVFVSHPPGTRPRPPPALFAA